MGKVATVGIDLAKNVFSVHADRSGAPGPDSRFARESMVPRRLIPPSISESRIGFCGLTPALFFPHVRRPVFAPSAARPKR